MKKIGFYHFSARFLLAFAVLIILWGSFVRISGSGDGCGKHWPLCQGYIVPHGDILSSLATWIEYFHRLKSGLFGIATFGFVLLIFIHFPKGSSSRRFSIYLLVFTILEALLGAALVLYGWVNENESIYRLMAMSVHLLNTFILIGTIAALDTSFSNSRLALKPILFHSSYFAHRLWFGLFFLIACAGSWAALSNTLHPSESLHSGILQDFSSSAPWIVRLRVIHPIIALSLFFILFKLSSKISRQSILPLRKLLPACILCLVGVGLGTLLSLSPTLMKLLHLLLIDLSIICFYYLTFGPQKVSLVVNKQKI